MSEGTLRPLCEGPEVARGDWCGHSSPAGSSACTGGTQEEGFENQVSVGVTDGEGG